MFRFRTRAASLVTVVSVATHGLAAVADPVPRLVVGGNGGNWTASWAPNDAS